MPLKISKAEFRFRLGVCLLILAYLAIIVPVAVRGFGYYRLPLAARAFHPLNRQLRPSGVIGIRMALFGVASFLGIYLYAIRKRWNWLSRHGSSRRWLQAHVVMGAAAPFLITLHSSFRARGLAGAAYWLMLIVALSGFVGRYLYAQAPRRLNAAELSLREMQSITDELTEQLQAQRLISAEEMKPMLAVPSREEVERMPLPAALALMVFWDLMRPFRVARLRRRALGRAQRVRALWGFRASNSPDIETIVQLARQRSWMAAKISLLTKTHRMFHLWHVIHRPFSYSFAILACVHIGFALFIGYY
jgi:hypothetical protein